MAPYADLESSITDAHLVTFGLFPGFVYIKGPLTHLFCSVARSAAYFRLRAALPRRARGAAPGLRRRRRCPLLACRCYSWPSRLCRALWPLRGLSPGAALRGALALCVALRGGLRRGAPLRLLPPVASPPAHGPWAGRPRAAPLGLTFCLFCYCVGNLFLRRAQLLCVHNFCCFPLQVGTSVSALCPRPPRVLPRA